MRKEDENGFSYGNKENDTTDNNAQLFDPYITVGKEIFI